MKVTRHSDGDYRITLQAPESAVSFSYRTYQRTNDNDIEYKAADNWLQKSLEVAEVFIGAEVSLPCAVIYKSPWNFTSSEEIVNWDVVLCVGQSKFYAHKSPNLPKTELLRTAMKINCAALEDEVIATFTKKDVQELLASDPEDDLDSARWRKIVAKVLAL
ncbi:hypothetical protein AAVH_25921 [Aphelenchoides avenae]|nr:hypothetical protein AAVH_25921 [Aphelenchus avenae]